MKNIFYILLLLPTFIFAQYPGNAGQKITLGEQTTADGLVWRGRLADTANLLTNKLDTSVYIVLDTGTRAMWYYRASTTPKWTRLVDSLNNLQGQLSLTSKVTGTLPIANGGTGQTTLAAAGIVTGTGTTNYLPKFTSASAIGNSNLFNDASGNLGLGVTPSAWTINPAFQIKDGGSLWSLNNQNLWLSQNVYFDGSYRYIASVPASQYVQSSGGHVWYSAPSGTAGNAISFTQAMTLDASGRLGIGIASPTARLQVKGSGVTSSTTALKVDNSGNTNLLTVLDNGNVGIGSATPESRLDVKAPTGDGVNIFRVLSATTGSIIFRVWATTGIGAGLVSVFDQTGTEKVRLYSTGDSYFNGGNVGIGTTSPASYYSSKLVLSVGDEDGITIAGVNDNYLMFADGTTGDDRFRGFIQYSHTSDYMAFATNAGERMRITSGGNVGIGTNSPSALLNVMGTVRINSASAPDANYYLQLENSSSQKAKANAWDTYSDRRIKTDIQPIFNAIDKVNLLNPVYYQKHDSYVENDFLNIDYDNSVKSLGFIAQEVYNVIPEAVNTGTTNELWAMDYTKIIPILTKAIQEQQALIKALEQRILTLENK